MSAQKNRLIDRLALHAYVAFRVAAARGRQFGSLVDRQRRTRRLHDDSHGSGCIPRTAVSASRGGNVAIGVVADLDEFNRIHHKSECVGTDSRNHRSFLAEFTEHRTHVCNGLRQSRQTALLVPLALELGNGFVDLTPLRTEVAF